MKFSAISALLLSVAAISSHAFADDVTPTQASASAPLTRAQVRADLAAAYSNGTVGRLNKVSYPDKSMASLNVIRQQQHTKAKQVVIANQ